MPEQDKREWPTFADILSELDSLGGSRSRALSSLSSPTAASSPPSTASPNQNSILPTELAPIRFDTSALAVPLSETSEPDVDPAPLDPVDTPAETELAQSTDDRIIDEPQESPDAVAEPPAAVEAEVDSEPPVEAFAGLDQPDIPEPDPLSEPLVQVPLDDTGLIDWSHTDLADDAEEPAKPEIDWTTLAPEWDVVASTPEPAAEEAPAPLGAAEPAEFEGGVVFPFDPTLHETGELSEPAIPPAGPEFTATDWTTTTQESIDMAPAPEQPAIDSIATANAIESDLQDIFALDQVEDDSNVIPLHASSDDNSDAVVGLDTVFDPASDEEAMQEWVGMEPRQVANEDPWAHMRPAEDESSKGGFFGRGKFFGGADRKAAKESRREAEKSQESLESTHNGPDCPECGSPGQVDLDDPVGGKLHLSCGSCENVWSQPIDQRKQA